MFDGLPSVCYSRLPSTGESIIIKKGESGYWETEYPVDVDEMNKKLGVTKAQEQAMSVGSIFGWDVEGANPKTYENMFKDDNK